MPFNHDFAAEDEKYLLDLVRRQRGCFNVKCRDPSASKRCVKCQVASYCSRECQLADWKDPVMPHKEVCKVYRGNVAPDVRAEGNGQRGAVAIGLLGAGIVSEDICRKAMMDRAGAFLDEAKRCLDAGLKDDKHGFRRATIALQAGVVFNLDRCRLQCAATLHDWEAHDVVSVNHVIFDAVDEGEEARRRLHPPGYGAGDISAECRKRVVEKLEAFILKANQHGITVQGITYGRGLMWMSDEEFQKSEPKKRLEAANGGDLMMWIPDQGYAMGMGF